MSYEVLGTTDPVVREARRDILRILEQHNKGELEFEGTWEQVMALFESAHLVTESVWYLKLGGYAQCAVCRKKEQKKVNVKSRVCERHADWRVVVLHDRAEWVDIIKDSILWIPPTQPSPVSSPTTKVTRSSRRKG